MNQAQDISKISSTQLLSCLNLAIDEARLSRSLIQARGKEDQVNKDDSFSARLSKLDREITYLEAKLIQVRGQTKIFSDNERSS